MNQMRRPEEERKTMTAVLVRLIDKEVREDEKYQ